MIKKILLFLFLSMQYILSFIFKSDIPMHINDGDILCIGIFSFLIFSIIFLYRNNYKYLFLISFIFCTLWLMDTIYLLTFPDIKTYSLNIIGVCTCICSLMFSIYKLQIKKE